MSELSLGDQPAFPVLNSLNEHTGLTKREWFAGLAMQGSCANPDYTSQPPGTIAADAESVADALLAELEKSK